MRAMPLIYSSESRLSSVLHPPLAQPFLHVRLQPAQLDDILDEVGERRRLVLLAARQVVDDASLRLDLQLVAGLDRAGGLVALKDRQADVDRIAEEDPREGRGDDGADTGTLDADRRHLARGAAAEVRPRDDDVAAGHL